jgi:hypothetical protein
MSRSLYAGIDIVNVVVCNPCGTTRFRHLLAEKNKMVFFPWHFADEPTEVFLCSRCIKKLWE